MGIFLTVQLVRSRRGLAYRANPVYISDRLEELDKGASDLMQEPRRLRGRGRVPSHVMLCHAVSRPSKPIKLGQTLRPVMLMFFDIPILHQTVKG